MENFRFENFTVTFTIFTIVVLLVYMPRLFFYNIVQLNGNYLLVNTSFKSTRLGVALNIIASVIRGPIVISINFLISILTDFKFVQVIKRKKQLTKNLISVVEGKVFEMVIF